MEVAKIVAPMVGALINTLGSSIWAELGTVWGVRDDIERLQRLLLTISAVLEDAERRSISDGALRRWLKDLKDAALDAEDVLGEFQIETLHKDKKGKVCVFFSSCDSIAFHYKMAGKVKGILKRFDEIAEDKAKFHLVDITTAVASVSHQERETFSSVDEDEIFGRSDDKEKVMEWLTEVDNDRNVSVLSIVGLGGVGKTTLAKLVYNDKKIKKHFKIRMWVCVGEKFDVNGIMKAILECATREKCKFSRLQDMQQRFQEKLENKRYLLILDDVWNNDASQWEALKLLVRGRTHGNKIVVTTRNQEVAVITSTMASPHKLEVLSDDDCWMLFKQKAFGQGRREQSSNLVQIGKEIVGKCEGLPLAAKALGSLMATKRTEAEWFAIRNSDIWKLERGTKEILPALQLSYDHLPPQLKQCFIYCSIFPKDYLMKRLELIQLWIAQAFIQPKEGMQLEDIGNQYFNSLLGRAFFHNEEKDDFGNIVSCQMHDLVHALACFVAQDESSIVQIDENIIFPPGCCYSTVICHDSTPSTILQVAGEPKKLRSFFLLFGTNHWVEDPESYIARDDLMFSKAISNLIHLRALRLDCLSNKNIVSIVGRLKHLRFLRLQHLQVEVLPDSITNLRYLQTLDLYSCSKLKELPKGITKMNNLRHLGIEDCSRLTSMPCGLGRLTNLQTLSLFYVSGNQSYGTIAELQHLNQIKGELTIVGLGNVKDPKHARDANISSKPGLQSLTLIWDLLEEASEPLAEASVHVLECLQPHCNLKRLEIQASRLTVLPEWLGGLTSLQYLKLQHCNKLETLPDGLRHLAGLKELHISYCPILVPRCQRETGEDWHKIAHIPNLQIVLKEDSSSSKESEAGKKSEISEDWEMC